MAQNQSTGILSQIEADADYYSPEVYQKLELFSSIETEVDSKSLEFLPVTPVRQNPKLFVIGLLPPSSFVSGRILDRSASVANRGEIATEEIDEGTPTTTGLGVDARTAVPKGPKSSNSPEFWDQFVVMCNRLGVQADQLAKTINHESGFNPAAVNPSSNAKGLNQLMPAQAKALMTDTEFAVYEKLSRTEQLKIVEKYYKGHLKKGSTAAQIFALNLGDAYSRTNPDGSLYHGSATKKSGYKNAKFQEQAYLANKSLDKGNKGYISFDDMEKEMSVPLPNGIMSNIDAARARLGMTERGASQATRSVPNSGKNNYLQEGSKNAAKAANETSKLSNTGLNASELGQRYLSSQYATVRATQKAIDDMAKTPPLKMLVNPQSFAVSDEKVILDGSWSRNGPIVQHWGPNQAKLEVSGSVAAFYSIDLTRWEAPGLTRTARNYSAGYQNFLSLYLLYRNNGNLYLSGQNVTGDMDGTRLSLVGSVYIYYDGVLYLGSFDDFSIRENDKKVFSLEYSYTFTVRARFRLDRPDEYTRAQNSYAASSGLVNPFGVVSSPTRSTGEEDIDLRNSAERLSNDSSIV